MAAAQEKHSRAPGKPAQVADVRQMRDQQRIQAKAFTFGIKGALAPGIIHCRTD
jgi:hypothetical protein